MKTKAQVLEEFENYQILIDAVIERIGFNSIIKVIYSGIDAGYGGFIYYVDTHNFAMTYRDKIVELLDEEAQQLVTTVEAMVGNFGIFRGSPMDDDDKKDLHEYLSGGTPEEGTITNMMAWFCSEEVCRFFVDTEYDDLYGS